MKKRICIVILICILSLALGFVAISCDDTGDGDIGQDDYKLSLDYISSSDIIKWNAVWADSFELRVYFGNSADGLMIYSESDILPIDNHRKLSIYYEQSGKYFIEVSAFKDDEKITKTLTVDIEVDYDKQYPDADDYEEPDEYQEPEGFKNDIGRLKKVYYHVAKSDEDLSITLANQNGVKNVSGFMLGNYGDWSYDEDKNTLVIDSVYLKKFSSGARLMLEVEYNDGRVGKINIELADEKPLDVIKGGISLTGSQIYSNNTGGIISILNLALNYDIFLGYGKDVSTESSVNYVVSIDGKKLLSSAYACYSKESKITLTANKSLSGLSYGMHLLEIYTAHGKSEVWLNVRGAANNPLNVKIDYDSVYPDVYVTWEMLKESADGFVVKIGKNEYSSAEYPELFDGYRFNAKDKISYGDEVRVIAVFDGIEETSSAVTLDVDVDNSAIQGYLSYANGFEYLGTRYNTFINSYDELKSLVFYSLIHYADLPSSTESGYEKMWRIYVNPSFVSTASNLENNIKAAVKYFNEGVKDSWLVKGGYINIYELHFKVSSTCIPDDVVRTASIKDNMYNDTHFSTVGRSADYDGFAVNDLTAMAEVTYSEELYRALEIGVRPIPIQGSPAQTVYDRAKSILRNIIDDNMNYFQKVHAIADWLSANVTYNWALADELSAASSSSDDYNKYYSYRELYLEGAILDGLAVCNGYAKAVSLLCGIEGIPCYKIKGASGRGVGVINPEYAQHAWNKVYIEGSWYVLDSTWANEKYQQEGSAQTKEVLKHNTLFMSDEQSGNYKDGAHYEIYSGDYSGYYAGSSYDVFANTFFIYDGNLYDMVIDDAEELKILLKYLDSAKGRDMGRGTFVTVDVRCDSNDLKQYINALKGEGLDIFTAYSVSTKYLSSYGNMTGIVLGKL